MLVPEWHPHPENQIRSSIIGLSEMRMMGASGSDATRVYLAFSCEWQASMRVAGTRTANEESRIYSRGTTLILSKVDDGVQI